MRSSPGQPRVIRFFEQLPLATGLFAVVVGVVSLAQWQGWTPPHGAAYGSWFATLPLAALSFVLAGGSLALMSIAPSRVARGIAVALATIVVIIAVVQAASWAADRDLGLDLLLFRNAVRRADVPPVGRLAVNTIAALLLEGAALVALYADEHDGGASAQWFAYGAVAIGFLALVGYAFGAPELYAAMRHVGMSLTSAVVIFVLGIGTAFVQRESGMPGLLTDPGAAGSVARRLVPAAILIPVLLGWARLFGERDRVFDTALGVSLYVVATVVIFIWVVRWASGMARESDRTRQALLEGERTARAAAEEANLAKSNFLAVMSHELRTPLAAIIGYEELLADGITGPVNDAQRHQLGRMKASAQHLLHLIDQILTFSRIDAGREVARLEDVQADEMAHDAAALVEPLAQEKGLELRVVPLGYVLPMRTDGGKVRQILVNLLSNAVKFTSEGSVTLTVQHDGSIVRYIVEDTGIGIATAHLDRIFDAFWQVEQPSTRRAGGTGLGLSVTRRLARLLGGDVTVSSQSGEGSRFIVELPLESDATASAPSPPPVPPAPPSDVHGEPEPVRAPAA